MHEPGGRPQSRAEWRSYGAAPGGRYAPPGPSRRVPAALRPPSSLLVFPSLAAPPPGVEG
jgi:hypothetical protein